MNTTTTAVDATSNNEESILDDLLGQLGDDTVLETIGQDHKGALDEVIESGDIVQAGVAAEALVAIADNAGITDELIDALAAGDDAANKALLAEPEAPAPTVSKKARAGKKAAPKAEPAAAAPVAPAKGKGKGKKATTVPAGYGSDADEDKKDDKVAAPKADDKSVEPKEPAAPKAPRVTSITHSPGDLLMHKLGTAADDILVFDLNHTAEQMTEARAAFIARMNDRDAIADKVREKICMLLVWLQRGGAGELNEVLKRSFQVLHKEGKLTSGEKGNLQQNLLSKPYSLGTARSQANQMFMALPELGITIKNKGEMLPNENSPLLSAINAKLGLA